MINFQLPKILSHVTPVTPQAPSFGFTGSGSRANVSPAPFLGAFNCDFPVLCYAWTSKSWEKNEVVSNPLIYMKRIKPKEFNQHCCHVLVSLQVVFGHLCSTFLTPVACEASETHSGLFIHINRLGGWMRQFSWGVVFWRLWNEISNLKGIWIWNDLWRNSSWFSLNHPQKVKRLRSFFGEEETYSPLMALSKHHGYPRQRYPDVIMGYQTTFATSCFWWW